VGLLVRCGLGLRRQLEVLAQYVGVARVRRCRLAESRVSIFLWAYAKAFM
jgi:hypothetical protein